MAGQRRVSNDSEPVKIGVINDVFPGVGESALQIAELAAEEMTASGRVDRGIEFVLREQIGAPMGRIMDVHKVWRELVEDEDVLLILGTCISDNWMSIRELAERYRVPHIGLGASQGPLSEYCFSVPWGGIPEDCYLIVNWLVKNGYRSVTITWDTAWHCTEYMDHLRRACAIAGVDILTDRRISQLDGELQAEQVANALPHCRNLNPDAIIHMGTGSSARAWATAVHKAEWDIPRIMNNTFYGAYLADTRHLYEGWVGSGMEDPDNAVLAGFLERYQARYGEPPSTPEWASIWYDGARAALEGIALAPILTREGVKEGLERIKSLPAAMGGPRTFISFGSYDRRGLKGMDSFVLHRVKNGERVFEGRYDPAVDLRATGGQFREGSKR